MDESRLTQFMRTLWAATVVLLLFASGVALLLAGRHLNSAWVAGLSAIPFAIALFILASMVKAEPWIFEVLKLVFPQLRSAMDTVQRIKSAEENYQSVLERLKSYLEENDLPDWSCNIDKMSQKMARQTDTRSGRTPNLTLLNEMQEIIREMVVKKYPLPNRNVQVNHSPDTPAEEPVRNILDNTIEQLTEFKEGLSPDCGIPVPQESQTEVAERVLQAISLIGLAVFINKFAYELLTWRDEICQRAARIPETPLVMLAYLELKENREQSREPGGRDYVTLCELVEQWVPVLIQRHAAQEGLLVNGGGESGGGFCHEVTTLRQVFQDREWMSHLWQLLQRVYDRLRFNLNPVYELQQTHPQILQSLKRIFNNLDLTTIERFLEARTVNAYLLAFNSAQGNVATLIDSLSDPQCRAAAEKLGLNLSEQEYLFKKYMHSSRIGVIPKEWSFQRFHEAFETDLNLLIEHRARLPFYKGLPLKEIEIVVQQFGLRDHFTYPPDGSPFSDLHKHKATQSIRELLANVLDEDDFLPVIAYEHRNTRIIDLLIDSPIAELIGNNDLLTPGELDRVAEADSLLKTSLLQTLNRLPPTMQADDELVDEWVRWALGGLNDVLPQDSASKEKIIGALVKALSEVQADDPQMDRFVRWAMRRLGQDLADNPALKTQAAAALAEALCKLLPVLTPPNRPGNQPLAIAEHYIDTLEAIGVLYQGQDGV